jgi:hypothetical protein
LVKCINLINGEVKKYKITGDKIRLATSVAEKTDALEIYVTCVGKAVISVDGAKERLLSFTEIEYNKRAEQIISAAYNSKFVAGQNLLQRYNSVEKEIPSMRLLSVVYEITDADVFITVIEEVELYKKIAKLFGGFNIIFLYSGGNDFAAKLVSGFIGRDDIGELYKSNCFMYFIDRVTTSVDTIYFLSRMKIASEQKRAVQNGEIMADSPHIAVNEINGKTYPYTKTVVLQNADKKQQIVTAAVSVILGGMSVVSCDGKVVTVVGLYSHRTDIYKLPQDAKVCIKNEIITDRIEVIIKTRLSGYEQKKFPIIKNEGVLSPKERKSQFLKSIENICVVSTDAEFSGIFAKNVTEKETPQVLFAVKSAVRNADRKLFISVLSGRNEIGADTWAYLLNKIIGIRNIKNSVQIVPDISITGDFSLSFDYNGQTHNFSIVKNGGGCAINYGSEKGNNFLEIPFDQK